MLLQPPQPSTQTILPPPLALALLLLVEERGKCCLDLSIVGTYLHIASVVSLAERLCVAIQRTRVYIT